MRWLLPRPAFLLGATAILASSSSSCVIVAAKNKTATSPSREQDDAASSSTSTPPSSQHYQCGLYLAPSSIPGAGLGMYNGHQRRRPWEPIGPADLVIPVTDYTEHNHYTSTTPIMNLYGWDIPSFEHLNHDANAEDSIAFCPGPGAALNCLMALVNTVALDEELEYKTFVEPGDNGKRPPHAGSFTPFSNRQLIAKVDGIEPGAELFDDYGEAYFRERPMYQTIPVSGDYEEADELLGDYDMLRQQVCGTDRCHAAAITASTAASSSSSLHNSLYDMMQSLKSVWPSPVLNALPETPESVDELTAQGTAMRDYNRSLRSLDWLETKGDCMDKLIVQPSTIPNAGNGAFATAFIASGSVVGPAPALHIPRDFMHMYPIEFDDNEQEYSVNTTAEPNHQQLLLNYCFGHNLSSLLLCPYGAATLAINHNAESPNAKIAWNYKLMQHPEWLNMPLSEWIANLGAGLVLNYVATRDIQVGDEVLIDYGADWQDSWEKHVRDFQQPGERANYVDALTLNEREEDLQLPHFRYDDRFVQLKCRGMYLRWLGADSDYEYTFETDKLKFACRPLHRYTDDNGEAAYIVQLYEQDGENDQCFEENWEVLFGVPRDALVFEDRLYSRDHAQPWSFRHEIGLPDELMPEMWRDLVDA